MPQMKLLTAIALALTAGALLVACGGDGEELTKQQYSDEVLPILERFKQANEEGAASLADASSAEEIVSTVDDLQSELTESMDQLEALSPPADAEQINSDLISSMEEFNASLDDFRSAAEGGDDKAFAESGDAVDAAAQRLEKEFAEISERASEAGIPKL